MAYPTKLYSVHGVHGVLALLLPLRCLACAELTRRSKFSPFLCAHCSEELHALAGSGWNVDGTRLIAAFRYAGPARTLVQELKFKGALGAALPLGRALGAALSELPPGPITIVPVPLHWRRRWHRGHNQSAALARVVASSRPGFTALAALRKSRATTPQVGLDGGRRRGNVRGTFAVPRRYASRVRGARLVVVDDVATTAATLRSARDCLVAAGAAEVTLAAAAVATEGPTSGLARG